MNSNSNLIVKSISTTDSISYSYLTVYNLKGYEKLLENLQHSVIC